MQFYMEYSRVPGRLFVMVRQMVMNNGIPLISGIVIFCMYFELLPLKLDASDLPRSYPFEH